MKTSAPALSDFSRDANSKKLTLKAIADYYASQQAMRDRTERLRQLRLARDAEQKRDLVS
jgi:hypothetical protein